MLDFDELQEFPTFPAGQLSQVSSVISWGTQNHPKTLYDPLLQGSLCMGIWWQLD